MDSTTEKEPIAIVGMSFQFPGGATNPDKFWEILKNKTNTASDYPPDRFNVDAFWNPDPQKQNTITSRKAHFIEDNIKNFDGTFFSMAPHEVGSMDPQQRLMLETTYHCLEDAGLKLQDVAGSNTSVHIGCFTIDYGIIQARDLDDMPKYNSLGTASSMLANRLSWFYDLRGESLVIDTACSSSLVALAKGCQGLWAGESDMALIGGSSLLLGPEFAVTLSNMNFLSPSGKSHSFDAKANGYGRGEGVAIMALKPLSKAIADKTPIRALIRSVGLNQDGYTSGGITQPSRSMQAKLIQDTYASAGLNMKYTRFFEAHGTGTAVGDPIESRSIGEAFLNHRSADDPLYIGAVKSNIGHLEGSSGMAGIVKTVLALEHGYIPPNANFECLNPAIDDEFFNLKFPVDPVPWPSDDVIRRASVNSFGFGGSNAHVVLEDAKGYFHSLGLPVPDFRRISKVDSTVNGNGVNGHGTANGLAEINGHSEINGHTETNGNTVNANGSEFEAPRLLILSATDEVGVYNQVNALSQVFSDIHDNNNKETWELVDDVVFTLHNHRTMHKWKSYKLLKSVHDLHDLQDNLSPAVMSTTSAELPKLGLVFTGQGAQWAKMAIELLHWPIFHESICQSQKFLNDLGCQWSILDELARDQDDSHINKPEFSQVLTTSVQIGLASILAYINIKPTVAVGHSSGEIAAAFCAGYLDHQSAISVSYFRGLFASKLASDTASKWGMAAIGLSAQQFDDELQDLVSGTQRPASYTDNSVAISCINSPKSVTISGPISDLDAVVAHLSFQGTFARRLKVDVGYHSAQMKGIATEYRTKLEGLRQGVPLFPGMNMVSSVTPGPVGVEAVCTAEYWVDNMVSPVRFLEAVQLCSADQKTQGVPKSLDRSHYNHIFTDGWLELGPHAALKGPLTEIWASMQHSGMLYSSLLKRNQNSMVTILEAVGTIFCNGYAVDLSKIVHLQGQDGREPKFVIGLPHYTFNHSVIHWTESARSRTLRTREHATNPLCGSQTIDWNPLDPKWRMTIKLAEMPWIADHRVRGQIWYPAAGMLCMALEALKQLLPDKHFDFEFRDTQFRAPIVIDEAIGQTDIQLSLSPLDAVQEKENVEQGFNFKIFVWRPNGSWDQVCNGTITPKRSTEASLQVSPLNHGQLEAEEIHKSIQKATTEGYHSIDGQELYQRIDTQLGLQYGSTFQGMTNIRYSGDYQAVGELKVLDVSLQDSLSRGCVTIHPSTLDSIFQFGIPALSNGLEQPQPTMVPSFIGRLWISRNGAGLHTNKPDEVTSDLIHATARRSSSRSVVISCAAIDNDNKQLTVQLDSLESTEVSRNDRTDQTNIPPICHELHWKPDFTFLTAQEVYQYCAQFRPSGQEPAEFYINLRLMVLGFAQRALDSIKTKGNSENSTHSRYSAWLKSILQTHNSQASGDLIPAGEGLDTLTAHYASLGSSRADITLLIGQHLENILLGNVDPLQLLFTDTTIVADANAEHNTNGKCFPMLAAYLDLYVHKNPAANFLEVGAGTGSTTKMILDVIGHEESGPQCAEYTFTDISTYFFGPAEDNFSFSKRMKYKALDISSDPTAQGFEEGAFDVVIAANVLHACPDLHAAVANTRRLLKPGGKLILLELTAPEKLDLGFVWGTLPGWWLGHEEYRRKSAIVTEDRWDQVLKQEGFTGAELVFRDWDSDVCHSWSIIISSALPEGIARNTSNAVTTAQAQQTSNTSAVQPNLVKDASDPYATPISIILESRGHVEQLQLGELMRRFLKKSPEISVTGDVRLITFDDLRANGGFELIKGSNAFLLADMASSHLQDLSANMFDTYKKILMLPKSMVWIQSHSPSVSTEAPYYAVADGLCRVCRTENPYTQLISFVMDLQIERSLERACHQVLKVWRATVLHNSGQSIHAIEQEFKEIAGYISVPRLRTAGYLDAHIFKRVSHPVLPQPLEEVAPVYLNIETPGLLDTLEWVQDDDAFQPLADDYVEIDTKAIGVNFKDTLILLGRVNEDAFGFECAGVITRIGKHVQSFTVGDRVATCFTNTYRNLARVPSTHIVKIPDFMSFEDAAAVPIAFSTAYYCLYNVAKLQKGESILIHAAAGGTGQAALQFAKLIGAEIYATVGSATKRDAIMEQFGIPADHIFYSRNASFADDVRRMTNGRGVDVVLNCLSGKLLVASWELLADFGRFVEIGRKDIDSRGLLPMFPFINNTSFHGVDLAVLSTDRGKHYIYMLKKVFDMMATRAIHPMSPVQTFPVGEAEHAFRLLMSGKTRGKIVLTSDPESVVKYKNSHDSKYRFRDNVTYVVVGGLGGLGQQIVHWLVRRGAKNVLIISRSSPVGNQDRADFIQKLVEQGVNLQCQVCEIARLESLVAALQEAARTMPPIAGCFQAAMVLQDRPFENMSHEEWQVAISPKVQGSWNLHQALPKDMEFFIMLSSMTGISGNGGQANYAAGNSFQDALARHRAEQGLQATAIDLGFILGKGWVEERQFIKDRALAMPHVEPISQEILFSLLDYYCNPNVPKTSVNNSQLVTGIRLPALIHQKGASMPEFLHRPLFSHMQQVIPEGLATAVETESAQNFVAMFEQAESEPQAAEVIAQALLQKLCHMLGLNSSTKTINDGMDSFGVDSLIALEIRNWLTKEMHADLAIYEILGDAKLIDTGTAVAKKSKLRPRHWK